MSDSCGPVGCSLPAPLSMGFSRQEYWSGLLFPSPGDLPDPETEPGSPALPADSTDWATRDCHSNHYVVSNNEIPGPLKIGALYLSSCLLGHEISSLAWLISAPHPPKEERWDFAVNLFPLPCHLLGLVCGHSVFTWATNRGLEVAILEGQLVEVLLEMLSLSHRFFFSRLSQPSQGCPYCRFQNLYESYL